MKNNRRFSGFTLAEVLIVVAIAVILAGVAFVSVFNHMRSLAQLERDTIAKEIFVAAQNHLTTAESQGYLNLESSGYGVQGNADTEDKTQGVYYLVIPGGMESYQKIFDLMLPFGAVDETVRAGGSYIIRYQPAAARVLDVFYCARSGRFALKDGFQSGDYSKLMSLEYYGESKKSARRNYGDTKAVVGWYGGEASVEVGERLKVPTIEIINAERLQVKVTNPNQNVSLQLIITGENSKAKKAIKVLLDNGTLGDTRVKQDERSYLITLDDITNNTLHFCQLGADQGAFIPGENISIRAIAFSNSKLTNVARSQEGTTNSLFGYDKTAVDHSVALISNIRHLENLDYEVSTFAGVKQNSSDTTTTVNAKQTTDLVWSDFLQKVSTEGSISQPSIHYFITGDKSKTSSTEPKTYKPVTPKEYTLEYNGNNHSISAIDVNYAGYAGIFGSLTGGSVSDLLVLDSTITSSSQDSLSGSAGGLIGSMSGTAVTRCAANGTVNSDKGAAGGLIGSASSGKVTACYSAGHTSDGSYEKWIEAKDSENKPHGYDVTGATAGGLIGDSAATVSNSYSTCSVSGTSIAGGFIGNANSVGITNCYATGLVDEKGETIGAFAGIYSGEANGCLYYESINPTYNSTTTGTGDNSVTTKTLTGYLKAVGGSEHPGITPLDANAGTYDKFVGAESTWADTVPKDNVLLKYYNGSFPLRTVDQIGQEPKPAQDTAAQGDTKLIVNTHYGDWPAPEIFVINTGTSSGSSGNGNGETAGG